MKKIFTLLSIVAISFYVQGQTNFTATYDFAESPTNNELGALTGSTNLTISKFSTVGATYVSDTGNRYANSGAPTGTLDTNKYVQVTLTPSTGYSLTINSLTVRVQRSGTGPRDIAVRSSADNYTANLPATINPTNAELSIIPTNVIHYVNDIKSGQNGATITPTNITDVDKAVTFRFYFFNSEANDGTFSVDDVVINGTTKSVPLGTIDNIKEKNIFLKNTMVDNTLSFQTKGNATVRVYNTNGQLVKTANVSAQNANVNVANLPKGNYVVTAELNGETVSQKILKK
jgi:hypothetical protein